MKNKPLNLNLNLNPYAHIIPYAIIIMLSSVTFYTSNTSVYFKYICFLISYLGDNKSCSSYWTSISLRYNFIAYRNLSRGQLRRNQLLHAGEKCSKLCGRQTTNICLLFLCWTVINHLNLRKWLFRSFTSWPQKKLLPTLVVAAWPQSNLRRFRVIQFYKNHRTNC